MAEAVGPAESPSAKKNAAAVAAAFFIQANRIDYFDTAFLNARSIFSLVASQQAWLA
jgi:hypothetical protein